MDECVFPLIHSLVHSHQYCCCRCIIQPRPSFIKKQKNKKSRLRWKNKRKDVALQHSKEWMHCVVAAPHPPHISHTFHFNVDSGLKFTMLGNNDSRYFHNARSLCFGKTQILAHSSFHSHSLTSLCCSFVTVGQWFSTRCPETSFVSKKISNSFSPFFQFIICDSNNFPRSRSINISFFKFLVHNCAAMAALIAVHFIESDFFCFIA